LDGSYEEKVFVAFRTSHFSTFNCDAPVNERGCVKGRLTVNGEALAGISVGVHGVSYTGSAGTVYTGADGSFASDLMKSEVSGQDVDGNGARGETFQARIVASAVVGVHVGQPFDTPTEQSSIEVGSVTCKPADCDCVDLGDIEVEFETPRACEVTVNVTYSGEHLIGSGGPLASGDAVADTNVTGKLTGAISAPLDPSLCADVPCNSARTDEEGSATFIVPVFGDAPSIELRTSFSVEEDGDIHYYEGTVAIDGCARGEGSLSGSVDLELTHSSLGDLGGFIQSLGDGPAVPDDDDQDPLFEAPKAPSCACRAAPAARGFSGWVGFALAMFGAAYARRRARLDG
jgi:hypothetical protein